MLRFEPLVPAAAAAPATARTPAASDAGTASFPALFREIRQEVADFIERGSDDMDVQVASSAGLHADGQVYQALLGDRAVTGTSGAAQDADPQRAFIASIAPLAREAGQRLGVAPHIIAAHAALESGWGQRPLRNADGSSTNNLFGVKASAGWLGQVANAATTEYEDGVALGKVDSFRSFPDQASAFRDFVRMMRDNPRYQGVLNAGGDAAAYARGLVRGGYATDPAYADKLLRVVAKVQSAE